MNKRVLLTSIILVVGILVFLYVVKIFYPQEFVLTISNPQIIKFGLWVDSSKIIREIFAFTTSLLTYYLFLCAACKKWRLSGKQTLIMIAVVAAIQAITYFKNDYSIMLAVIGMFGLSCIYKGNFAISMIVFTTHTISQALSTEIRGLSYLLPNVNYATIFCLMIEGFGWLILFYLLFNYKKRSYKNG